MANTLAPFGFSHLGSRESVTPSFGQMPKSILLSNATPIYAGDPVVSLAGGSSTNPTGQEYVAQATPGTTQIAGILVGCEYQSITLGGAKRFQGWWPGNGDAMADPIAYVIDDPLAKFLVQANGQLLPSHTGLNCNFAIGVGNKATGRSGAMIDVATIGPSATLPFRILRLVQFPAGANGADITTPYSFAEVVLNNADSRALTGI